MNADKKEGFKFHVSGFKLFALAVEPGVGNLKIETW